MSQTATVQDFAPLPQYRQTTTSNDHWITVTTVKTESDGSTTQRSQIISKRQKPVAGCNSRLNSMEEETTFQVNQEQVEQALEQFDFDDYLLSQLDTLYQRSQALQVRYQVYLINSEEILTNAQTINQEPSGKAQSRS